MKYHWNEGRSFLAANYAYQQAFSQLGRYILLNISTRPSARESEISIKQSTSISFPRPCQRSGASLLLSQTIADAWQFSAGYYFRDPVRVSDVSPDVTRENRMRRLDLRMAKTFKFDQGRSADVGVGGAKCYAKQLHEIWHGQYGGRSFFRAAQLVDRNPKFLVSGTSPASN